MKTNLFITALLTLFVMVGNAGCNKNENNVPEDMHEVKVEGGFSFLCPDILKPGKDITGAVIPEMFLLSESDFFNNITYRLSESDEAASYTPEFGKKVIKDILASESSTKEIRSEVFKDGFLLITKSNDPNISTETIYTAMRIILKGNKKFTVTLTYTESKKDVLEKYRDAVVNSVKAE